MAAPKYLQLLNGFLQYVSAQPLGGAGNAETIVSRNTSGLIDPSNFPAGIGQDIATATASESLSAGAIVNLYTNAGALNARNADATTANGGKKASGFVIAAVASGATASVYRSGMNTGVSGLTPGTDYFLGTAGATTATPTTTSGQTSQYLGTALSATTLDVQLLAPIGIA